MRTALIICIGAIGIATVAIGIKHIAYNIGRMYHD